MNQTTLREYGERYLDAIRGRLATERARDDSDSELERCLGPCVCGDRLVPVAKQLRDDGFRLAGYYPDPAP